MKTVDQMVTHFENLRANASNTSMYEEVKWQYINMANGGNGGTAGFVNESGDATCREINYKNYPDSFFVQVCERMGWIVVD